LYFPNGVGIVVLRPHHTVAATPALINQLSELVGNGAVAIAS
jgi:hypothetical protein